ncbi:MAG: hypothetical protein EOO90_10340 [Pedobacter sp.]|nr:MAG: hypothetical protein EOO90_10340 [Pedobacter sp.]
MKVMCQDRFIKVIDQSTGKPIEYCTVTCSGSRVGGFTDKFGLLKIKNQSACGTVLFNAMGYEKQAVDLSSLPLDGDTMVCRLLVVPIQLDGVVIKSSKRNVSKKSYQLGFYRAKKQVHDGTGYVGRTNALFIPNIKKDASIKIEKLIYSIAASKTSTVRLQVFGKSPKGTPGASLISDNLIVEVRKGDDRIVYDISKYNLFMPSEGVFISIQWLGEVNSVGKTINVSPVIYSHRDKGHNLVYFKFLDREWQESKSSDLNTNKPMRLIVPNFGISVVEYK